MLMENYGVVRMKGTSLIAMLVAGLFLAACKPAPQTGNAAVCAQAANFIERNRVELQNPRDWNRLMTAGSRLVYIENSCGALVMEPRKALCASLAEAIEIFVANPKVPPGLNRDSAIAAGKQTYQQSGCEGADLSTLE
jgi:hypothetical protein